MSTFSNHKLQVYAYSNLALIGESTNIISAEGENGLDVVGKGSFKVHGSDTPTISLLAEYRIARVTAVSSVSGAIHEICCFIIRKINKTGRGAYIVYTVSGPDLIGQLLFGTIGFAVISDNASGPSATPIADALLFSAKTWTFTEYGTGDTSGGTMVGSGETAFVVLITMLQQLRGHVSFSLFNNPNFHLHIWYENTLTSGTGFDTLTLLETTNPASYQSDPATAIITKPVRIEREEQEVFTRAYVFGAGMGVDRITIKEAEGLVTVPPGYTVDFDTSLIINSDLEALQPSIGTVKSFPAYEPEDVNDETSVQTNAMGLFSAGYYWLKWRTQPYIEFYEFSDLVIHRNIVPGQLVRVTFNRSSPVDGNGDLIATDIIDIDKALILISITHKFGAGGVRYSKLVLGETPKRPSTGLNYMAEKLKELEETIAHTNAGAGGSGSPGGATTYLHAAGSGPILTGDMLVDPLVLVDGVDISAHAADFDPHHVPGTLSQATINFNDGTETHEVDASSDPGAQAYLLETDASGRLILVRVDLTSLVLTDRNDAVKYNIFIENGRMYIEPV